jgi:uncharacterized oxidoreductase
MKFQHRTVLITGGSSGIGLELARQLIAMQNTVLICGRSQNKLSNAKEMLPLVNTFCCDLSIHQDLLKLMTWISEHHPLCDVLINNAAMVHKTDFRTDERIIEKAEQEIKTNLMAPVALSKMFLSMLDQHKHASIINITTGLIYAPRAVYPIYNATKAALHSFTQVLRHQLSQTPIDVIEVMMPVVDTPWHKGDVPKMAISPEKAVNQMMRKLQRGEKEIRVGAVNLLYWLSKIAPDFAFKKINQIR